MIALPKILLFVLLAIFAWYATRWLNKPSEKIVRRRPAAPNAPQAAIEDLVACGRCGAYMVSNARNCGKAGCPQPR
jgi:hypothetical protein